jgi:5'-3' exonuclease
MGVKSINPFLKEKCPEAFKPLPYSYFKGKRVAVDSDNVLRKLMSRAHKEIVNKTDVCVNEPDRKEIVDRWLHHTKEEIIKFLRFGITLIFVFDGSYIDEKSDTQTKRKEAKQKMVKNAVEEKRKVLEIDELERTPQMVTELRKKMHHLGNIRPDEKDMMCEVLRNLGFPVLFATEEGEKLCAMLCIEGYVDAVYSRDTDVVAMGCPLSFSEEAGWIHNPETGKSEMAVKCTIFRPILQSLNMEYTSFLDLCIMSGCDFNSNIFNLGCKKAYKLLCECKSIDNLPEKFNDKVGILNHVRCRQIFGRQLAKDICKTEIIINIDLNALKNIDREFFIKNGIEDWISELSLYYNTFQQPSNIFIEKPPSYSNSVIKLKILNKVENSEAVNENIEIPKVEIPKQKASPKKLNQKMITDLNTQQLLRFKEKDVKKVIKLKIIS